MDVTSTSAATTQINQAQTAPKNDNVASQPPEDNNLKAIQSEIKQITTDMKKTMDSKLQPLAKDTVEFNKTAPAQEVAPAAPVQETPPAATTPESVPAAPATPVEAAQAPTPEPIKENTPAA